ncbi:MAG: prepilin-type N-terminal cleavage/methylation domain-containing protein [Rhizomicrobium sp.]
MRTESGFTLIELLVSMTLLGLLFVLLFGGLRFGMRAWEHSAANADASDSVRTVQGFLRSEIEQACPRRMPVAAGQSDPPRVRFAGSPRSLVFLGPIPGGAACSTVTLLVVPDGRLQRIDFRMRDGARSQLLGRVQSVALAYLGRNGWQGGWDAQPDLPALVRVRVTFPAGDARSWPELFIAPRISAEADCTYDPRPNPAGVADGRHAVASGFRTIGRRLALVAGRARRLGTRSAARGPSPPTTPC